MQKTWFFGHYTANSIYFWLIFVYVVLLTSTFHRVKYHLQIFIFDPKIIRNTAKNSSFAPYVFAHNSAILSPFSKKSCRVAQQTKTFRMNTFKIYFGFIFEIRPFRPINDSCRPVGRYGHMVPNTPPKVRPLGGCCCACIISKSRLQKKRDLLPPLI